MLSSAAWRRLADQALDWLNPITYRPNPEGGHPSIPPEQLPLALLLQAFQGMRSDRIPMEQLDYNLLFHWFGSLNPDETLWHPPRFAKCLERLFNEKFMAKFLELLLASPDVKSLLRSEHFSVDGTLLLA